jgi:dTDP-4-dehydrorhamnose 3,5-epimerase
MRAHQTDIDAVLIIEPSRHFDDRGFLSEVFNESKLSELGITTRFVQENHTLSIDVGTVRGLHFQISPKATAKLVRVTRGAIFDVAVDLRRSSPSYAQHVSAVLDTENWRQLFIPEGFAHGFCTLQPDTEVVYWVSDHWSADVDRGVRWDDPGLHIGWPVRPEDAIVSEKDRTQPLFTDLETYFV